MFEVAPRGLRIFWSSWAEFCSIGHLENVPETLFLGSEHAHRPGRCENWIAKNLSFFKISNIRLSDSRDLTVSRPHCDFQNFEVAPRGLRIFWSPKAEFGSIGHFGNVPETLFLGLEHAYRPARCENWIAKNSSFSKNLWILIILHTPAIQWLGTGFGGFSIQNGVKSSLLRLQNERMHTKNIQKGLQTHWEL